MTLALLDERIPNDARIELERRGYHTILMPACDRLPVATASHPDMLVMKLGDELIVEGRYFEEHSDIFREIASLCPSIKISCADVTLSPVYPDDCKMNALTLGERIFLRVDSVCGDIVKAAEKLGMSITSVRQGYPACTVLALGDSHAITADRGMASALRKEGVEVLLIDDGDILLPPYEYGFIGGATGVHRGAVYFIGDIRMHKNASEIEDFSRLAGYEPISLCGGALLDLGRIIFIDSEDDNDKGQ